MLRYIIPSGLLVYSGETVEQADKRQKRMQEHNDKLDRLLFENGKPMPCMRAWAVNRGILQSSEAFR